MTKAEILLNWVVAGLAIVVGLILAYWLFF
jgi:hypothetical protein